MSSSLEKFLAFVAGAILALAIAIPMALAQYGRYTVESNNNYGAIIKVDRWTGRTWLLHTDGRWSELR